MRIMMPVVFSLMIVPKLASADGLDSLIEVGRGQAEIQKAYTEETKVYERVKRAVDDGAIKKGSSKKNIQEEYGAPIISYRDFATKREVWVYKPARSDFMDDSIKIRLYFDASDAIDEITVTGQIEEEK
jgi:uncharacterized protein YqiB (DUF1249 family)